MHALRAHRRGGPEEPVYQPAPRPPLGIGDALVAVHAASFTPTELDWPSTWTDRLGRDRVPVIPGHEVSGVVAALGYGTSGVEVGQQVHGLTDWYRDGAAADYVAVEARNLAPKPASGCWSWVRPAGRQPRGAAGPRRRRPDGHHRAGVAAGAAGRARRR
jgi:NADPH:quinone reductase-like Zn-dependent oxidoreductase